jgi:hypothetical protein
MKKYFLLLFAVTFLGLSNFAQADATDASFWNRSDYQEHMATSYALAFTSYELMTQKFEMQREDALIWSTIGTIALGFVRDEYLFKHTSDLSDYTKANFIGATASGLIVLTFHF